jgi:hypothetical protein
MLLGALIEEFRRRVDDTAAPYLWSSDESVLFANAAEREAAVRAKLLEDSTTPAVVEIDGQAQTASYPLHTKIIEVRSVTWGGRFMTGVNESVLADQYRNGWRTLTGTPTHFLDPQQHSLTLFRTPTAAKLITLSVYRLPLADMELDADAPEIPERYHIDLVPWMEHLAYSRRDADSFNPKLAAEKEAEFTARFGVRPDANVQRKQRDRRSNTVKMNPTW